MNQIINIDFNKNIDNSETLNPETIKNNRKKSPKKLFNVQFFLSITAILIITSIFIFYKITLNHQEDFSNLLINNYLAPDSIIGMIEIPTINTSYPIFNTLTDDLLKTSPCRFYGDFPSSNNNTNNFNLCIAGHNYDNDKFFSKIKNLSTDDKIFLYDTSNNKYVYSVIKNYEVEYDDLSPVYNTITNSYELTLVTCNNFNGKRIIIKAKIEDD